MFKWTKDLTQYKEYAHSAVGWMWEVLHRLACLDTWSPLGGVILGGFFFFWNCDLVGGSKSLAMGLGGCICF